VARLDLGGRPLAIGCMRLSTAPDRDEGQAVAVLHAALDAGVRLLDTADAYAHDESEAGHNERLVRRALESWNGPRERVVVATKGGLTRPGGRWEADGRARHLRAACEASRRALGVERIALYQLHAPDPSVPLATSVRALRALQREGLVHHVGLSNVNVGQLDEASALVEIAAVQVELGYLDDRALRGGVAAWCVERRVPLLAYRPLGGPERRRRLGNDPALREVARRHGATPFEIALAWLHDLDPAIVPLPGPSRVESVASIARAHALRLTDQDRAELEARVPGRRRLHAVLTPPPADAAVAPGGEVVLVMGLPAAGKSTLAGELAAQGHARLNRDEKGGRLADLLPALDALVAEGRTRIVLDNTYGTRHARAAVIERAHAHGLPVRCLWASTTAGDAQVNACARMVERHGRLLDPAEMKRASRTDPGAFGPGALFRHQRELEPPDPSEGFASVTVLPFVRRPEPGHDQRAVFVWCEGVLRRSRDGHRVPRGAADVELLPGRAETLARWHRDGFRLLGLSWLPELAEGSLTPADAEGAMEATRARLGLPVDILYCPHAAGPPVCWCRKPLPGLGVVLARRHRLDLSASLYVGTSGPDRTFARVLGLDFREADAFFAGA
jgi:aryl-alcohol dehydrogenase-like predicted oxidoreductase/histidinol phosphatase-like enzyme/predicted kinase